jgi:predicted membrane channel-forming protein YqfA (hemolysin III family)
MEPIKYPELYEKCRMHISRGWKAIIPIAGIISSVVVLPFLGWQALVFGAIIFGIGAVVYCIGYGRNRGEVDKLISEWPRERYF